MVPRRQEYRRRLCARQLEAISSPCVFRCSGLRWSRRGTGRCDVSATGSEATIRGIFPIVYTPFDPNGAIHEKSLGGLVEYLIAAGTHGLAAVGGASECHKMTVAERKWL